MKLYVTFTGEEEEAVRFVVLLDGDDSVAALRRRVASDFRATFPGRPPLCFFRMASSDGFFLTDAARLVDVLEDGGAVICHRADSEAKGAPLSDSPSAAEVDAALTVFRNQVTYVARAACHAALLAKGGQAAAEAMSVVLALLLLEGRQLSEVRLEALAALRRGLAVGAGSGTALPSFLAAGGLFVLLNLLSPSTKMDSDPGMLDGAARLLEQLTLEHAAALAPVLADCAPAALLQKLALDSRCTAAVRKRVLAARRLLEPGASASRPGMGRPHSSERSDRLRLAGAAVAAPGAPRPPLPGGGAAAGGVARGAPLLASLHVDGVGAAAGAGSPALAAKLLAEHGERSRDARAQALAHIAATAQGPPAELRELARSPHLPAGLLCALRAACRAPGDRAEDDEDLAALSRALSCLAADRPARAALASRLGETLLGSQSIHEAIELLRSALQPRVPQAARATLVELVREAMLTEGNGGGGAGEAAAAPELLEAMLDASAPEELQIAALRALNITLESAAASMARPSGARAAILKAVDEGDRGDALGPGVLNAALLRAIPRQPLLCLEVLASLVLREAFRTFFASQGSLLQFLVHCCEQPGSAPGAVEPSELQRAAAKCLANLSSHPAARERIRRSASLRGAYASTEDLAARAYLSVALGAPTEGAPAADVS